jgi:hypothetical protein
MCFFLGSVTSTLANKEELAAGASMGCAAHEPNWEGQEDVCQ